MVLDNEQQKALLLHIISATGVSGSYTQAKEAVRQIDELLLSINEASVADKTVNELKVKNQ